MEREVHADECEGNKIYSAIRAKLTDEEKILHNKQIVDARPNAQTEIVKTSCSRPNLLHHAKH